MTLQYWVSVLGNSPQQWLSSPENGSNDGSVCELASGTRVTLAAGRSISTFYIQILPSSNIVLNSVQYPTLLQDVLSLYFFHLEHIPCLSLVPEELLTSRLLYRLSLSLGLSGISLWLDQYDLFFGKKAIEVSHLFGALYQRDTLVFHVLWWLDIYFDCLVREIYAMASYS